VRTLGGAGLGADLRHQKVHGNGTGNPISETPCTNGGTYVLDDFDPARSTMLLPGRAGREKGNEFSPLDQVRSRRNLLVSLRCRGVRRGKTSKRNNPNFHPGRDYHWFPRKEQVPDEINLAAPILSGEP
jgi:hypothetical protein